MRSDGLVDRVGNIIRDVEAGRARRDESLGCKFAVVNPKGTEKC